jgi:hypothetical protein
MLVVACVLQLVCGGAWADPRDIAELHVPLTPEQEEARRVQMAIDMDAWLRQLEGKFRIEGVFFRDGDEANIRHARGKEDCITIGPGAGLQCVINVVWDEDYGADGQDGQNGVSSLAPAMIEYGYDPVAAKVRYLQVDNQSLAEPNEGTLKNETVRSSTRCANTAAAQLCQRVTRIYVPPDRSYITMTIDVERNYNRVSSLQLDLRPMTPEEWAEAETESKLVQRPSEAEPVQAPPQATAARGAGAPAGGGRAGGGGGGGRSRR